MSSDKTEKREPRWRKFLPLLLPISFCLAGYYCNNVAPSSPKKQADRVLERAPLISPGAIRSHCDTGKAVRMVLYTGKQGVLARNGKTYAYECLSGIVQYTPASSISSLWPRRTREVCSILQCGPAEIKLFDSSNHPVLQVVTDDINSDLFPTIFDPSVFKSDASVVPAAWVSDLDSHKRCQVQALPAASKVSVIGTLWKTSHGIYLRGYSFTGLMGEVVSAEPIVSPAPMEKVLGQFR